jgi:hypothetical protein
VADMDVVAIVGRAVGSAGMEGTDAADEAQESLVPVLTPKTSLFEGHSLLEVAYGAASELLARSSSFEEADAVGGNCEEAPALAALGEDDSVCLATAEGVACCRSWAIDAGRAEAPYGDAVAVDEVAPGSELVYSGIASEPHHEPVLLSAEAQTLSLLVVMEYLALPVLFEHFLPREPQPLQRVPAFQAPRSHSASESTRLHPAGSL